MRIMWIYGLMGMMIQEVAADQSRSYKTGLDSAAGMTQQVKDAARSPGVRSNIPHYRGESLGQCRLTASSLEGEAHRLAAHDRAGNMIQEQSGIRQRFTLDPAQDPLFTNADKAVDDPFGAMNEVIIREREGGTSDLEILQKCSEAGPDYTGSCVVRYHPRILKRYKRVFLRQRVSGHAPGSNYYEFFSGEPNDQDNYYHEWQSGCNKHHIRRENQYRYASETVSTHEDGRETISGETAEEAASYDANKDKEIVVQEEAYVGDCEGFETLSDAGRCHYDTQKCVEGDETRVIAGVPIHRSCWAWRRQYRCSQPAVKGCGHLRAQGCVQIGSRCDQADELGCIRFEQTYRCPSGKRTQRVYRATNESSPFCLTGNCLDTSYEANGEMLSALSHMAVFKEMQNDIRANLSIFKGSVRQCTKNCVGFRDCCGSGGGWGVSMGLAGCSGEERELSQWRSAKKCVFVGTYCAEKKLGICLRKKSSFCCFGSKLSRIIQEQGRQQLGMGWGSGEHPECRGLKPEELSRLNFSNMDLSELFEEVRARYKEPSSIAFSADARVERLRVNMTQLNRPSVSAAAKGAK